VKEQKKEMKRNKKEKQQAALILMATTQVLYGPALPSMAINERIVHVKDQ
jgi:hypothetical protein